MSGSRRCTNQTGIVATKASGAVCIAVKSANPAPQNLNVTGVIVHSLEEVTEVIISAL
jgi:hypothetical protein